MMTIKIKMKNDEIITKINGTLEEIARYYFRMRDVYIEEIEILEGGELNETECYKTTATLLYRAPEWQVKKYELAYNIRYCYKIEYKPEYIEKGYENHSVSAGLCNVA